MGRGEPFGLSSRKSACLSRRLAPTNRIHTSDDYGVMNVFVTLKDEWGNHLESDYAMNSEVYGDHWGYIPSASLPAGKTVIVQAMALDFLGGAGLLTERVTV